MGAFTVRIKGLHLLLKTPSPLHKEQRALIHTAGEHFFQSFDLRMKSIVSSSSQVCQSFVDIYGLTYFIAKAVTLI